MAELRAALGDAAAERDDALTRLDEVAGMAEEAHAAASEQEEKAGAFLGEACMRMHVFRCMAARTWLATTTNHAQYILGRWEAWHGACRRGVGASFVARRPSSCAVKCVCICAPLHAGELLSTKDRLAGLAGLEGLYRAARDELSRLDKENMVRTTSWERSGGAHTMDDGVRTQRVSLWVHIHAAFMQLLGFHGVQIKSFLCPAGAQGHVLCWAHGAGHEQVRKPRHAFACCWACAVAVAVGVQHAVFGHMGSVTCTQCSTCKCKGSGTSTRLACACWCFRGLCDVWWLPLP